ncbi:MAG: tetratricopeptide repeat protein, partial [Pseudonocardiaceae bacterium]
MGDMTSRRKALKLSLAAAIAPEALHRVLSDAAADAMEFTRLTGVSSVGHGTLEHLELVLTDLNRGYSQEPPTELFVVARAYRSRVDELIKGRHTLKELRELYVYAGWLSELLAWLAHDLGNSRTAQAYAVDCYEHAEQAGHGELCGWAADAMTAIATYAERPGGAVQAAMKGIALVPTDHPLAIRLRAKAARAYARLGDQETFDTLFAEARNLYDHMPAQIPSRFTINTGTLASYAIAAHPAQAYLWLEDFQAARTHAEAALAVHESAPPGGSSTGKGAIARLDLANALAHLGEPDEAVALGNQGLTSTCAANFVRTHARDLNT